MCLTACLCSFMSLTMLTFNRYFYVCHHNIYDKIYNRTMCIILCFVCWCLGFLFMMPNLIGWGDHVYDLKSHQCIWDRTAAFSYTVLISVGLIGFPLLMMAICFILTFRKIWRSKFDVYSLKLDDPLRYVLLLLILLVDLNFPLLSIGPVHFYLGLHYLSMSYKKNAQNLISPYSR